MEKSSVHLRFTGLTVNFSPLQGCHLPHRCRSETIMECYDRPDLWDFAFSDETDFEADFIQQMASRWLNTNRPAVLEIGCGGGRQTVNLAMRGLPVTAFDLNPTCVRETQRRLKRRRLAANVFTADMLDFQTSETFDLAHCLVNTFRHLTDERSARCHLQAVARALRPGGLYLLGFHLLPPDAAEEDCERWTLRRGKKSVTVTVRVLQFCRRTRLETVRFSLKATLPSGVIRLRSDHQLRIYRADQFRSLLRAVPEFELLSVHDFCYDADNPLPLDDQLGDAVFVLRRRG